MPAAISYYTLDEILIHYRDHKNTPGIIRILSEMSCVSPKDMKRFLEEIGVYEPRKKNPGRAPKWIVTYTDSSWKLLIEGIKKGYPVNMLCDQVGIRHSTGKNWKTHADRLHIPYDMSDIYRLRERYKRQNKRSVQK